MAYIHDGYWYIVRENEHVSINQIGTEHHVEMPLDVFDAIVEMRHAQLAIDRPAHALPTVICERFQSLGSQALREECGLPSLLEGL